MTAKHLAAELYSLYDDHRLPHLRPQDCTHDPVQEEFRQLADRSGGFLRIEQLGNSLEGRSINLISCGSGKTPVLLWSQMHGDETTATLALLDITAFLIHAVSRVAWVRSMLSEITIHAIPMLNPDGAERGRRQTASQIDVNRDARAQVTPESKILLSAHRRLAPAFGFNLHDQGLSSVGSTPEVAALALLAPACDESRSKPLSRVRAMRLAALMAHALDQFIAGHIASYDDTYEPRAFGDGMQSWGTSTVLIESGHWVNDPEKAFIRKLNFVAILTALHAIGDHSYQDAELEHYTSLKLNRKKVYHCIIRDVIIEFSGGESHHVDIGLEKEPARNPWPKNGESEQPVVTVREIGDLKGFGALQTINAHGRRVSRGTFSLDEPLPLRKVLDTLQIYLGM